MASWTLPPDLHHEISSGPLCPFGEHAIGSRDGRIPRYSDSHACVRCVSSLTEGRLSLDVRRIHPRWQRRFLEYWSFVDITDHDECWEWRGARHGKTGTAIYSIPRHWSSTHQWGARRVGVWLSWGDIGRLPIKNLCGNSNCVNPLHSRILGVPHFYNGLRFDAIELDTKAAKLINDTGEFLAVTRLRDPRRFCTFLEINTDWMNHRLEPLEELDFSESLQQQAAGGSAGAI